MQDEVQIAPRAAGELKAFLIAQLRWERYRAARLALVHVLALLAVGAWMPAPQWLAQPVRAALAACFLGALYAGMMELRWGRQRNRLAGDFPRGGPP